MEKWNLDIPARKTIDSFTERRQQEGPDPERRARSDEPLHRHVTASATKSSTVRDRGADRIQYDLKDHKIVRTIPWRTMRSAEANIIFSPTAS